MPINEGGLCEFETFFAQNLDVFKEEKAFRNISTPVDNFIFNNHPEKDPVEIPDPPIKETLKNIGHPFSRFLEDGTFPVDDICPPCEANKPQCKYFRWISAPHQKIVEKLSKVDPNNVRVRVLGMNNEMTLPESSLEPIDKLEPSSIPIDGNDLESKDFGNLHLSRETLEKLWNPSETLTDDEKLAGFIHRKLNHIPAVVIRRYAKRGLLPKRLSKLKKLPPCASCIFGAYHKRSWRHRSKLDGSHKRSISRVTDTAPGKKKSADHIISAQPGLVPQVTAVLTHARF